MALVLKDRVRETSNTSGQATLVLNGAVPNYRPFSVIGNGNTTYYTIVNDSQWEVGVGTYTLSGTTLSRDTVLASSNNNNKVDFNSGAKDVFLTYPADKALSYDGAYNVGIGTMQPASKVQIVGTSTGYATPQLRIGETGSNLSIAKQLLVGYDTTNNYGFVQANQWNTSTTNLSLQPLGGNVGIGTSSPAYKLDVNGSISGTSLSVTSVTSTGAISGTSVTSTGAITGTTLIPSGSTAPTNGIFLPATNSVGFSTNSNERMRIDSSGNVGIGTATTTRILNLNGLNDTTSLISVKGTLSSAEAILGVVSTNLGFVGTFSNNDFTFRTNNTERLRIDSVGSVGLGVSAPTAYLHIKAGTATANNAPLKFNSGVNLTTAEAGAIEYDGKVVYATGEASQRGVIQAPQFITQTADYTVTSLAANTLNKLFNSSTNGAITVAGSTTYTFECVFHLSALSTTSGTFAFGFGGTATYSLIVYTATACKAASGTASTATITAGVSAAATTIATASVATFGYASIVGKLVIGTGGTIIPSFSISQTASPAVNSGSYFILTPIGSNTVQKIGNWS